MSSNPDYCDHARGICLQRANCAHCGRDIVGPSGSPTDRPGYPEHYSDQGGYCGACHGPLCVHCAGGGCPQPTRE